MSKKKKGRVEKDTSERWLLTYSDLMNLLLILFIILYACSKEDVAKYQQVAESLREGFSLSARPSSDEATTVPPPVPEVVTPENQDGVFQDAETMQSLSDIGAADSAGADVLYDDFYNELMALLEQNHLTQSVTVTAGTKGISISFADNVLFAKSSAVLNESSYAIIDKIGHLLKPLPYSFILVEGHADSDKIHNQYYEDNMDLSAHRATNVWRRLASCNLPPEKMASVGYGEYRPIAPNDSIENKAKNRRVVITILKQQISTNNNATIPANSNPNSE